MKTTQFSKLKLGAAPFVLGIGLIASASPAMAQDAQAGDDTASSGDEIIVTGTRIPQANLESAAPITVVTSQDIKLQGTTRVEDMLNSLPSVFASQSSTAANGADGRRRRFPMRRGDQDRLRSLDSLREMAEKGTGGCLGERQCGCAVRQEQAGQRHRRPFDRAAARPPLRPRNFVSRDSRDRIWPIRVGVIIFQK